MPSRRFIALRSPAGLLLFLLTMLGGLALDQWSKVYAFDTLAQDWTDTTGMVHPGPRTYEFIPGWIHFKVTINRGAVFGLGQGKRALFIGVSAAAILFIFYLYAVSGSQRFYQFILGMLLAGVLGNLYDRAKFGYVRDMIFALPRWDVFPYIFNVADTLLCVGVGLMILHSFLNTPQRKK